MEDEGLLENPKFMLPSSTVRLADLQNPLEKLAAMEFRERYRFTKQSLQEFMLQIQDGFNKPSEGVVLPGLRVVASFSC